MIFYKKKAALSSAFFVGTEYQQNFQIPCMYKSTCACKESKKNAAFIYMRSSYSKRSFSKCEASFFLLVFKYSEQLLQRGMLLFLQNFKTAN